MENTWVFGLRQKREASAIFLKQSLLNVPVGRFFKIIFYVIILSMTKNKIRPRILNPEGSLKSNSFFARLFINQRFLAVVGLIFLVLIVFPLARTYSQRKMVEKEISDVQKQINEFESANQGLKEMVAYLNSDQSLEEEARLNLNLKKDGEQVIVINNNEDQASTSSLLVPSKKSNLAKWKDYFFN